MAYQKDDRYRTVLKYLRIAIDIDNKPIIESWLVRGQKTKHDLSRDILKTLIKNEPNVTAYEFVKKLSFDIAQQNLNDNMALYSLYWMLGYCANQFSDIDNSVIYYKKAFDKLLENKINSEYVEILIRDDNCGKCSHLANTFYTNKEILNNNPLPPEGCTREYCCNATYMAMSERRYLRMQEEEKN